MNKTNNPNNTIITDNDTTAFLGNLNERLNKDINDSSINKEIYKRILCSLLDYSFPSKDIENVGADTKIGDRNPITKPVIMKIIMAETTDNNQQRLIGNDILNQFDKFPHRDTITLEEEKRENFLLKSKQAILTSNNRDAIGLAIQYMESKDHGITLDLIKESVDFINSPNGGYNLPPESLDKITKTLQNAFAESSGIPSNTINKIITAQNEMQRGVNTVNSRY